MPISCKKLAATALGLLELTIPYVAAGSSLKGMDCQGLVKYCAKQNGVTLKYSGSNDMFRNACVGVWPLAEAKRTGKILHGAVCFILERDGKEPDKYKKDGLGNASHIGVVTLAKTAWSVDASSSAGCVRARDERNAMSVWTHVGWLKGVEYEPKENEDTVMFPENAAPGKVVFPPDDVVGVVVGGYARVNAIPTVTFRREPRKVDGVDNRIPQCPRINCGETVIVLGQQGDWTQVKYNKWTGWIMTEYLTFRNDI